MREHWAKLLAALTGILVLGLAVLVALVQGRSSPRPASDAVVIESSLAQVDAGLAVYDAQGCARCHSIAGQGSARFPIDGVGARNTPAQLRDWITAGEPVRGLLPASTRALKETYGELPATQLDALVAYLSVATGGPGRVPRAEESASDPAPAPDPR